MQVLDHGIQVETLEFLGVVELLAHRIGQGGVLVQDLQVQLIRPPARIRRGPGHRVSATGTWIRLTCFALIFGDSPRCSGQCVFHASDFHMFSFELVQNCDDYEPIWLSIRAISCRRAF